MPITLLVLAVVITTASVLGTYWSIRRYREQIELQNEIRRLQDQVDALETQAEALETQVEALEREPRSELP